MNPLPTENVQSYPRPPRLDPVQRLLRLAIDGDVVAETARGWRVCETHHPPTYYFPTADVLAGVLIPVSGRSFCEWKGDAIWFDLQWQGQRIRRAA